MGPLKRFILFYFLLWIMVQKGRRRKYVFIVERIIMYFLPSSQSIKHWTLLQVTDLKGILYPVLSYLLLGLLGCCHLLWQVAEHKERLVCSDTNKLTRVGPKDLKTEREDTLSDSDKQMTGDWGAAAVWLTCFGWISMRRISSVLSQSYKARPLLDLTPSKKPPKIAEGQKECSKVTAHADHKIIILRLKRENKAHLLPQSQVWKRSSV